MWGNGKEGGRKREKNGTWGNAMARGEKESERRGREAGKIVRTWWKSAKREKNVRNSRNERKKKKKKKKKKKRINILIFPERYRIFYFSSLIYVRETLLLITVNYNYLTNNYLINNCTKWSWFSIGLSMKRIVSSSISGVNEIPIKFQ